MRRAGTFGPRAHSCLCKTSLPQQEDCMPARSKKQQMAAGAALAAKRGERSKASLKGASRQMVNSMSEQQLADFAKTNAKDCRAKRAVDARYLEPSGGILACADDATI